MTNTIKPTCNRKTRAYKTQENTYGLLPGKTLWKNEVMGTCPGATTGVGGCCHIKDGKKTPECYVYSTISAYPGVYPVLRDNTRLLQEAGDAVQEELTKEFTRFSENEHKRKEQNKPYSFNYRLHWSGDIFSEEYAKALRRAILAFPYINFWCYTRNMAAVPILNGIPNLNLYISLDPQNFDEGMLTYVENKDESPNLRLCYMSPVNDFKTRLEAFSPKFIGQNILRKFLGSKPKSEKLIQFPVAICPADSGTAESEGCCHRCKMCIGSAERHIWFNS